MTMMKQVGILVSMKVALVHDYLKDFGGAERVLRVLCEMYPEAPIFTAFKAPGSTAAEAFADREVIEWKHAWLIRYRNLHSVLRWLIPWIWESFDLKDYDVVISSASGYITKGIITGIDTKHICYCHTPPRFLYGYPTARDWQKWWPVKVYGQLMIPFLRQYDYWAAQRVDIFVANSQEVQKRIKRFYNRDSKVIYPPVEVEKMVKESEEFVSQSTSATSYLRKDRGHIDSGNVRMTNEYYLIVARLVGTKGLELALEAQKKLGFTLKIVGEAVGREWQDRQSNSKLEWLGRVSDVELVKYYTQAKGFLALAENEDFGMTVVESMACGTPVVAYNGGGYKETVINAKTGVLFDAYTHMGLVEGIRRFEQMTFDRTVCQKQAKKFSREQFEKEMMRMAGPLTILEDSKK